MEPDLALVIGLVIVGFSAPAIVSAVSDRRPPRTSMVTLILGGSLAVYALAQKPGGYRIGDIPETFIRVIAEVF
jgi:hypothetical protein